MGAKINPLFKLLGVNRVLSKFDEIVRNVGWLNGCRWLVKNLKIDLEFKSSGIPGSGAVIIYANHPTGLDPYLLTAVLGREDSYFWGDIYQNKKGKSVSKHIISIAPKPFWTILRRPLTNWPGYIYMRLTTPSLTKKETKRINKRAIDRTVQFLKKRNQIIIFPSGGEYEFLKPGKGLETLLIKCRQQKIPVKVKRLQIQNFGEIFLLFHFLFKTKLEVKINKL